MKKQRLFSPVKLVSLISREFYECKQPLLYQSSDSSHVISIHHLKAWSKIIEPGHEKMCLIQYGKKRVQIFESSLFANPQSLFFVTWLNYNKYTIGCFRLFPLRLLNTFLALHYILVCLFETLKQRGIVYHFPSSSKTMLINSTTNSCTCMTRVTRLL